MQKYKAKENQEQWKPSHWMEETNMVKYEKKLSKFC